MISTFFSIFTAIELAHETNRWLQETKKGNKPLNFIVQREPSQKTTTYRHPNSFATESKSDLRLRLPSAKTFTQTYNTMPRIAAGGSYGFILNSVWTERGGHALEDFHVSPICKKKTLGPFVLGPCLSHLSIFSSKKNRTFYEFQFYLET